MYFVNLLLLRLSTLNITLDLYLEIQISIPAGFLYIQGINF